MVYQPDSYTQLVEKAQEYVKNSLIKDSEDFKNVYYGLSVLRLKVNGDKKITIDDLLEKMQEKAKEVGVELPVVVGVETQRRLEDLGLDG
ncbi:MAG: hypothetical protein J7K22_04190 [Nanoarchaeota archaeon]|nr:hypothetical protein [Nanoarchaeota archaeon]